MVAQVFTGQTTASNYFVSNYPPYSCWAPDQVPELKRALMRPPVSDVPLGLYLHIPFCRHRCHYCYFRVYSGRKQEDVDRYLEDLISEFDFYKDAPALSGRKFSSIYFGGGSPSYLSPEQMRFLLKHLHTRMDWSDISEATFECDPATLNREKLETLYNYGITRLTLGFQSLNDSVLRSNGRQITAADCLRAYDLARDTGFEQINLDLLAGLAGDTDRTWSDTVSKVLELQPDCVTIYQMELTHNSIFNRLMQAGHVVKLPSWPTKRQWAEEAFESLESAGYTMVSAYMAVRNPAKWRFVHIAEHFWHGADLVGLGESAFGHLQGCHYQNVSECDQYHDAVLIKQLPIRRAYKLNEDEKLRRELILQMKTGKLNCGYFRRKFNAEIRDAFKAEFEPLQQQHLLEFVDDSVCLTRAALLQVDALLPEFYLPEHQGLRYT